MNITAKGTKCNVLKIIIAALTLIALTGMLSACGNTLSGKYYKEEDTFSGKATLTIEFKRDNKVTFEYEVENAEKSEYRDGTYEINDSKIVIKSVDENGEEEIIDETFEKGVDYIKIGDIVLIKKK